MAVELKKVTFIVHYSIGITNRLEKKFTYLSIINPKLDII